eukprot:Rhum_TRINITY_DN245_c0_g1::Rhum_TRINITY_DN245_c0_g1_i1::g.890::m.890
MRRGHRGLHRSHHRYAVLPLRRRKMREHATAQQPHGVDGRHRFEAREQLVLRVGLRAVGRRSAVSPVAAAGGRPFLLLHLLLRGRRTLALDLHPVLRGLRQAVDVVVQLPVLLARLVDAHLQRLDLRDCPVDHVRPRVAAAPPCGRLRSACVALERQVALQKPLQLHEVARDARLARELLRPRQRALPRRRRRRRSRRRRRRRAGRRRRLPQTVAAARRHHASDGPHLVRAQQRRGGCGGGALHGLVRIQDVGHTGGAAVAGEGGGHGGRRGDQGAAGLGATGEGAFGAAGHDDEVGGLISFARVVTDLLQLYFACHDALLARADSNEVQIL